MLNLMRNRLLTILAILLVSYSSIIWALTFDLPTKGQHILGKIQTTELKANDDFTTIAQQYDIGYYELYEANPGVDPDNPQPGTMLIIPTQYILPPDLHNSIVINLAEMRLYYESDKLHKVFTYPIGIGKEGWDTPLGYYKIAKKIKDPVWYVPKSIYQYRLAHNDQVPHIVKAGKDNPLGNFALSLSDPRYLIHGTNDPVGIGRRSSAGCIRLYPEDIKELFAMVKVGTKVFIINEPYKVAKQDQAIYLEAHMPLHEQQVKMHDKVAPAIDKVKELTEQDKQQPDLQQIRQIAKQHLGIPQLIQLEPAATEDTPPIPEKSFTIF